MSYREDGHAAVDWVFDYLERVPELPVLAQVEPGDVRRSLPTAPPERAEPFAAVLRDLDELLLPGITHWQHPRFFAYFATTASEPGILAELLAAALNPVAFLWRTSPASTELEAVAMDWLAQLLGLPSGWHGHIEDTASTSTLAALAAAREVSGRHVVVCSEQAHSSVDKAARLLGLELRKTPVDEELRLRPEALDLTDAAAVVATVGTTSTAAVDPVPAIADACEAAGVWLHVDAAYAGSAWVCPELRESQAGVERADSLVVNPHKRDFDLCEKGRLSSPRRSAPPRGRHFGCRAADDLRRRGETRYLGVCSPLYRRQPRLWISSSAPSRRRNPGPRSCTSQDGLGEARTR